MDQKFTETYGPWAIVTGASDGIGRAVARELAMRGLNLVLVARREEVLRTFAAELVGELKIDVRILALDLSVPAHNQDLFAKTKDLTVGLYCGIAGFGTSGEFLKNDVARELNMLDLNCRAVVEQTHHFGNRLKAQKRGGIVLMSSILAWQGVPYSANYAATKAFVQSLAEGLQVEMKPHGIDVLAVAPGPTATGFGARARMKMSLTDDAATVGRNIVRHIGKSKLVRPGWVARALEAGLAAAPRALRVRLMGQSLASMIERQD